MSKRFYDLLQNEVSLDEGMRILDVGCGTGALLKRLNEKYNIEAYGIDADSNMVAVAKLQCPACTFTRAPGEKIPFPHEHFDVLTACLAYHHFSDKAGFAKEAARVLKPGGTLYIADPRFPYVIRKSISGILRLFRIVGGFFTAGEIADAFAEYGFEFSGAVYNGYAQVVKLVREGAKAMPD
jgi:ubiquinone/menaquinone biosynthesis C-methylase UbiE